MTKQNRPIRPAKRYFNRINALAASDPQIGALNPKKELLKMASQPDLTLDQVISIYLDGYGERPALGKRAYDIIIDPNSNKKVRHYLSSFEMTSYQTLHHRIKSLAMAWRTHSFCRVARDEFVCTIGFSSIDFATIDMACAFAKAVTVPLQSSTSGADLSEIFANVEPAILATTLNDLPFAIEHAIQQPSIKSVLVFNYDACVDDEKAMVEQAKSKLRGSNTELISIDELITFGAQQPFSYLPIEAGENEKMGAILHSSGSTGKPKGAMISAKAMINNWRSKKSPVPRITVIIAPQNHVMGRNNLVNALNVGGNACFTLKSDLSSLFEDIRIVRPTFLSFFPRIFELIHQYFQNEVTRQIRATKDDRTSVETAIKAKMRHTYLGDRLLFGIVGSAPTSPKVRSFIIDCFDILLIEGYGNTETGSGVLTFNDKIDRNVVIDYKLRDVPELGYFTTDKPYPRGELCVKTKFGVKGYYKQAKATAGLNDENGYNITGDIVEERAPDHIVIIDRRKDVLKLSQGEYVAVGPLGTIFEAGSAAIQQIYVYGNSHRAYLLAVIVPDVEAVHKLLDGNVTDNRLRQLIRDELQKVGQKEELKSFEIPRDFIIEKTLFSQKNGLLSSVRKRLRPALKRKYETALENLYEEHDRVQTAEIEALKDNNSSWSTEEKLIKLLESNLGFKDFEKVEPRTFNELGGDSLGAALFSISIEEIFNVNIGADIILSPKGHIKKWVELIEMAQNDAPLSNSFEAIHDKGASIVHAKDLQLDQFINAEIINGVSNLAEANQPPKTVLMTGANGFLGHILCLKWLENLAKVGGKLICIIRASDDKTAKQRLDKKFQGIDSAMENHYNQLTEQHLEVLAGDIAEPFLGLNPSVFDRIARETDRICHVAALVNHRLAYQHLFRPNVVGTAEIIRLAITHRKKPIDFISTVGVQSLIDKSQGNNEAAPLLPSVKLSDHYAAGYATSKWASEHLLHQAQTAFNLTANIVRCDMILPDQRYKGQINAEDMVTRLLYSIVITGLAPISFYQLNADGSRAKAHYDGIPVDVLSDAIVNLSVDKIPDCRTFNAYNYLKDTISLDSFVDWIEQAGHSITRINHKEWFERMETKLKSLPEAQRQFSMINVMGAYRKPYSTKNKQPDCSNFEALARRANNGQDIPALSANYINKYLEDMIVLKLIDAPVFL